MVSSKDKQKSSFPPKRITRSSAETNNRARAPSVSQTQKNSRKKVVTHNQPIESESHEFDVPENNDEVVSSDRMDEYDGYADGGNEVGDGGNQVSDSDNGDNDVVDGGIDVGDDGNDVGDDGNEDNSDDAAGHSGDIFGSGIEVGQDDDDFEIFYEIISQPKKYYSAIWANFEYKKVTKKSKRDQTIFSVKNKLVCKHCNASFFYTSSTSSMLKHIKNKHNIDNETSKTIDPPSDEDRQLFLYLLTMFIVTSGSSMRLVENKYFVKLINLIAPSYHVFNGFLFQEI